MIKVKVLIPGSMKRFDIKCPQCNHLTQVDALVVRTTGQVTCWGCGALLEWEETEDEEE